MKKLTIIMLFCMTVLHTYSQTKGLKIGVQMPEYRFPRIMNASYKTLDLAALKGKWVILDLWASSCHQCIGLFPHMQELQDAFKGKLQIILVNGSKGDSPAIIEKIIRHIKKDKGYTISLPIALNDVKMDAFFPARTIPHEIIIDPDGKIIGITDWIEITKQNIQRLLEGDMVNFPIKDDYFNPNVPLVANLNSTTNNGLLIYSSLTGYAAGVQGNYKFNERHKIIGETIPNFPLIRHYQNAYPELFKNNPYVVYETSNAVFQNAIHDKSKLFTYDYINQTDTTIDVKKYNRTYQSDLDKAFNFSLHLEKRSLPCLIIKTNLNIANSYTKFSTRDGNVDHFEDAMKNHISVYGRDYGMYGLIVHLGLDKLFNTAKVVDESHEEKNIDIVFPIDFNFKDINLVRLFLSAKGIELSVDNRELNCLIVKDKKQGEPTIQ